LGLGATVLLGLTSLALLGVIPLAGRRNRQSGDAAATPEVHPDFAWIPAYDPDAPAGAVGHVQQSGNSAPPLPGTRGDPAPAAAVWVVRPPLASRTFRHLEDGDPGAEEPPPPLPTEPPEAGANPDDLGDVELQLPVHPADHPIGGGVEAEADWGDLWAIDDVQVGEAASDGEPAGSDGEVAPGPRDGSEGSSDGGQAGAEEDR
jgi:hypothetical protein